MKPKIFILVLLVFTGMTSFAQATSDSTLVQIETTDGNEFIGPVVMEDSEKIVIKTNNLGEITIPIRNIKSRKTILIQQVKNGKLWFANPQATRYFWAPNGFGLKKGEGYYQNIWVLWNQFAYGLTGNFSIGGGMIPLFFFGGAPTPVFGTVKFSIPVAEDKFNIGLGAIAGTALGESETGVGMLYGITTFGNRDKNVSVGMGYGFAGGDWASSPTFNVNGMFRVSSRGYFITENYIISSGGETVVLLSAGGRSNIKKVALDYGLFIPFYSEMDTFFAIPWLGFTVPFGNHQ